MPLSPESGMEVHVIDLDSNSLAAQGWLENTSLVQKDEMTDEQYEARGKATGKVSGLITA